MSGPARSAVAAEREYSDRKIVFDYCSGPAWPPVCRTVSGLAAVSESIIRKSKCSTDFKRNDFLKKTKRTHWVRFVHLNSLIESCVFLYLWNSPFDTFL